jgi:hypothetical protein
MRFRTDALPPTPQVPNGTKSSKRNRLLGSDLSSTNHPSISSRYNQMDPASSVAYLQPPRSSAPRLQQFPFARRSRYVHISALMGTLRIELYLEEHSVYRPILCRQLHISTVDHQCPTPMLSGCSHGLAAHSSSLLALLYFRLTTVVTRHRTLQTSCFDYSRNKPQRFPE